ncbi:MAG: PepSY domain-containing protein, partial [Erysipelotrichaceae bacterium]|nr:PepSY domain-containing protein [Erysipelotrichaceae bacterium]
MKKILMSLLVLVAVSGCAKAPTEETPTTTTPVVETTPSATTTVETTTTPATTETTPAEKPGSSKNVSSSSSEAAKEVYATINDLFDQAASKVKEEGKTPYALTVSYSDNYMSSGHKGYQISCLVNNDGVVWRYNDSESELNNVEFDDKFDVSGYYTVEELYEFVPGKVTREEALNAALDYLGFTFEDLTLINISEEADSTRSYYYIDVATNPTGYIMKIDANTKEIFDYYD